MNDDGLDVLIWWTVVEQKREMIRNKNVLRRRFVFRK